MANSTNETEKEIKTSTNTNTTKKGSTAKKSSSKNTTSKSSSSTGTKKKTASQSQAAASKSSNKKKTTSTSKKSTGATKAAQKNTTTTKTNAPKKKGRPAGSKNTTSTTKKTAPKARVIEEIVEVKESAPEIVQELHVNEREIVEDTLEIIPVKEKKVQEECCHHTLLGADVPTGSEAEDKKERKKRYMIDALIFAIVVPVLDLLAMLFVDIYKPFLLTNSTPLNYVITFLLDFVIIFVATYVINYLYVEIPLRKKRK